MWKRVIYSEWADVVPYVAFFLTFGVFLVLAVRALLMRRKVAERLAHLPLEDHAVPPAPAGPELSSSRGTNHHSQS